MRIRVAVVGAGSWAQMAHIPGWQRDPRVRGGGAGRRQRARRLAAAASRFGVPVASRTTASCSTTRGIDVIDVVTGNQPHFQISWDALSAGKHVLCEKPVHTELPQDAGRPPSWPRRRG